MKTSRLFLLALPLFLFLSSSAEGKELEGIFALGGQASFSGEAPAGLSLKYHVIDELGLEMNLGVGVNTISEDSFVLGLGIHLNYNVVRYEESHAYVSIGSQLGFVDKSFQDLVFRFGVEHFFTDHFSVTGFVSATVGLSDEPVSFSLGDVAGWGTGFYFYF